MSDTDAKKIAREAIASIYQACGCKILAEHTRDGRNDLSLDMRAAVRGAEAMQAILNDQLEAANATRSYTSSSPPS